MQFFSRVSTGIALLVGFCICSFTIAAAQVQKQRSLIVFAASSMKNALDAANEAWVTKGYPPVTVSYAASSTLANQIDRGAPADIFISADLDWMTYLKNEKKLKQESVHNLLGNRLVLIAAGNASAPLDIRQNVTLTNRLGSGKIAMGTVNAVPAGKYAKAALDKLGLWDQISKQIVQTDNVRSALVLVSRQEATLGIVYKTDAIADTTVAIIGVFPEDSHPKIIYPIGITASSMNTDAEAYSAYLRSQEAKPLFEKQGFTFLSEPN